MHEGWGLGQGSIKMNVHHRRRRGTPPHPQTKVTMLGEKTNFAIVKILSGHCWVPPPLPPRPLSSTSLGGGGVQGKQARKARLDYFPLELVQNRFLIRTWGEPDLPNFFVKSLF